MNRLAICTTALFVGTLAPMLPVSAKAPQAGITQIDLAERLAGGKLRAVNREATASPGTKGGVHLSEKEGPGVAWIEGSDFAEGTIEVDVRGRDVLGQSFLGVAFHRKDDTSYEAVYLRPFNFRAEDPARHQHAVQYIGVPGLRLAATEEGIPGGVRESGRQIGCADRLGAAPRRRQRRDSPDIRWRRQGAYA